MNTNSPRVPGNQIGDPTCVTEIIDYLVHDTHGIEFTRECLSRTYGKEDKTTSRNPHEADQAACLSSFRAPVHLSPFPPIFRNLVRVPLFFYLLSSKLTNIVRMVNRMATPASNRNRSRRKGARAAQHQAEPRWSVERAKASLSELMKQARDFGPQRITLYGRDAVVVVDAGAYDTMAAANAAPTLCQLLQDSPLNDLAFDRTSFPDPVRPVKL